MKSSGRDIVMNIVPGLIGAAIGGFVGLVAYDWGIGQNLKAGVVPGAFVGLGAGLLSARPSMIRGAICGLAALGIGLFAEWKNFPFKDDGSFSYFLAHVHQLQPLTILMIVVGTIVGWRWGGGSFKVMPGKPASKAE